MNCLVLNKITDNLPAISIRPSLFQFPSVKLADPEFHLSNRIDILIGADTFWNLLCLGQIKSPKHPVL